MMFTSEELDDYFNGAKTPPMAMDEYFEKCSIDFYMEDDAVATSLSYVSTVPTPAHTKIADALYLKQPSPVQRIVRIRDGRLLSTVLVFAYRVDKTTLYKQTILFAPKAALRNFYNLNLIAGRNINLIKIETAPNTFRYHFMKHDFAKTDDLRELRFETCIQDVAIEEADALRVPSEDMSASDEVTVFHHGEETQHSAQSAYLHRFVDAKHAHAPSHTSHTAGSLTTAVDSSGHCYSTDPTRTMIFSSHGHPVSVGALLATPEWMPPPQ